MSHTRAAFTVSGVVLAAIVVLSAFTGEHPTRTEEDRATIEAVADQYIHQQIADAWTQMKLGNARPLEWIKGDLPSPRPDGPRQWRRHHPHLLQRT